MSTHCQGEGCSGEQVLLVRCQECKRLFCADCAEPDSYDPTTNRVMCQPCMAAELATNEEN